jgi:hypothetical protein
MYLRIVTTQKDPDSHQNTGVFQRAYDLYDLCESGGLDLEEVSELKASLLWFELNLPTPDRSKLHTRAIFWFKPDAGAVICRVWKLAEAVKHQGIAATIIKTSRPGYILYEDDYQVAAIPFRDTFRACKRRNGWGIDE